MCLLNFIIPCSTQQKKRRWQTEVETKWKRNFEWSKSNYDTFCSLEEKFKFSFHRSVLLGAASRDKASPETCSLLIVDWGWDGRLEPRKIAKWSISTRNQEFVERYQAKSVLVFQVANKLAVNDRSQIPNSIALGIWTLFFEIRGDIILWIMVTIACCTTMPVFCACFYQVRNQYLCNFQVQQGNPPRTVGLKGSMPMHRTFLNCGVIEYNCTHVLPWLRDFSSPKGQSVDMGAKSKKLGPGGYLAGIRLSCSCCWSSWTNTLWPRKDRSFDWTPLLLHDMGYEVPPPSFKGCQDVRMWCDVGGGWTSPWSW